MPNSLRLAALLAATASLAAPPLTLAQDSYKVPSAALAAIVDAPLPPQLSLSPDRSRALLMTRATAPSIAELAAPELRLAGVRFNPVTHASNRTPIVYTALTFKSLADGTETPVTGLPATARFTGASWSPDGQHLALAVGSFEQPAALWLVDVASASARPLTGPVLNAVLGDAFDWLDNTTLVAKMIPADRGPAPVRTTALLAPIAQQSKGEKAAARTFPDLLKDASDETEFDYYATAELVRVTLDGKITPLGFRGLFSSDPSPDGRYVLVSALRKPYSYQVPAGRFPSRTEVLDAVTGHSLRVIADLPLAENIPTAFNSTRVGPRGVAWRTDAPATLAWFEARDGGDAGKPADVRDQLIALAAPFTAAPTAGPTFGYRAFGVLWGDDQRAFVNEGWTKTRRTRSWMINPSNLAAAPVLVFDRSAEDTYNAPGAPVLKRGPFGRSVVRFTADGSALYLSGEGASREGNRPFLDRLDLATLKTTRLWQSAAPHYEEFSTFLDESGTRLLTRRESATEAPNFFTRDLTTGATTAFTNFPNPYPQFAGVQRELISYPRADGVTLTGTLYLPPGWTPDKGALPTLLWAYPREFKSADAAGQVRDSPFRFVRVSPSGPLPFLLQGFAVLDDPAMPIIGEGTAEPNDTYVKQLVGSAKAAIDELVRRGVTDPARVAVGGHSYGAFMTANLLAHSDLFRAGIARSGAYNRTLTPFGFQAEERNFWEAPEIYAAMSPFNHANKIKDAILLIHGQADDNQGTFPVQSERMYQALKGLGATARYVQLPYEAHGYRARESLLHVLWETSTWLDTYVKNPPNTDKK
jgi:dipeptidyl aminopeptidase/acylaminoacyl peptidase